MRADSLSRLPAGVWSALLAAAAAWALYGSAVLTPGRSDWMLHGDPAQHLVGLAYFLAEPWHWPPGAMHGFGGPTSVVFTDSIPWVAIALKLLGWPSHWQPFGWWMLGCHAAAAGLSTRWLGRMGVAPVGAVAAGLMLAFAPVMLLRSYGHESLMAHALLPAALLLAGRQWSATAWGGLLVLALGLHPYWVVMLAPWALAAAWQAAASASYRPVQLLVHGLVIAVVMVLAAWVLGYGVGDGQRSAEGFGNYSANLLSWLDPMDWEAFLAQYGRDPALGRPWSLWAPSPGHSTPGQYEGYAWLGSGVWFLVLLWAGAVVLRPLGRRADLPVESAPRPGLHMPWRALVVAAGLLMVWSWSHRWGVGTRAWLDWPLPESVLAALGTFRASGRFIWPATWLLMLALCWRIGRWRHGSAWLVLALVLQTADLSPKLGELGRRFRGERPDLAQPLQSPIWSVALSRCPNVLILTSQIGADPRWAPVAWLAARHGAAVHPAPTARLNPQRQRDMQAKLDGLQQGLGWQDQTLYVAWPGLLSVEQRVALERQAAQQQPGGQVLWPDGYWLWLPPSCDGRFSGGLPPMQPDR